MNIVEAVFDATFPAVQERWERGGATITDGIPDFHVEVAGNPVVVDEKDLYRRNGLARRKIGSFMLLRYDTSDGIDRLVALRRLDDGYRSDADFMTSTSTAWTTTVNGYAGRRDRRIALETGIQTVSIGAEGSTNQQRLSQDLLNTISLAKTAQSEQAILARLSKDFDLPRTHYALGDSRGAMIKPAHAMYAPLYGNEVLFTDIKAPCVPDRLTHEDMPKVAMWLGMEALGAAGVGLTLTKDADLGLLLGTFDSNPKALHAATLGIMPALMTGEAGVLADLAPNDMRGHVVLYGHDILSSAKRWHEIYQSKPDMFIKNVARGSHAHLIGKISLQIARIKRAEELMATGQVLDDGYIIRGIRSNNKKQAGLQLVANL